MGGLFGGGPKPPQPQPLPKPRVVRQPTETDPDVEAAARRTRQTALRRRGRASTILTDQNRATVGSGGQKLGA